MVFWIFQMLWLRWVKNMIQSMSYAKKKNKKQKKTTTRRQVSGDVSTAAIDYGLIYLNSIHYIFYSLKMDESPDAFFGNP